MARRNPVCPHCKVSFLPDSRNGKRQRYCNGTSECRKASRLQSQKKWLNKPENRDYFRSAENVIRVQQWRKNHPGYSRKCQPGAPLQDDCEHKTSENRAVEPQLPVIEGSFPASLQDICMLQPTVLIGLIAHLTGSALQEDIAQTFRRMQELGSDILNHQPQFKGGHYDAQTSSLSRATTPGTGAVQLA
jgi:hypothetical protein